MAKESGEDIIVKENDRNDSGSEKKESSKRSSIPRKEEQLLAQVEELTQQLSEARDKYLRLYAEFDNYKKRTLKEKLEFIRTAAMDTIVNILPVLDDFDRAKKSAEDENTEEQFSEGVKLVYNKLYQVLRNQGLKEMESNGVGFDPEFHEAVTEIPAPEKKLKGKVIDTIEKGYMLNDKIIRHAKVIVGK